jgi:hypothetical protein
MSEQTATPPAARVPRRRSLYRTVLSLAAAAIVAASLPFSVVYVDALSKHSAGVGTTRIVHSASGQRRVTVISTRTSGSLATTSGVTPAAAGPATSTSPVSVTTRSS